MTALRVVQRKSLKEGKKVDSPGSAYAAVKFLKNHDREKFYVLHLDAKLCLIARELIFQGSLTNSIVHAREVFKAAVLNNSAQIILAHNHPSGDPTPSADDQTITDKLIEAGKLLGIPVNDHIIVGRDDFFSFGSARGGSIDSSGAMTLEAGVASNLGNAQKTDMPDAAGTSEDRDLENEIDQLTAKFYFVKDGAIGIMEKAELKGILADQVFGFGLLMDSFIEEFKHVAAGFSERCSMQTLFERAKIGIDMAAQGAWKDKKMAIESLKEDFAKLKKVIEYHSKAKSMAEKALSRATVLLNAFQGVGSLSLSK